MASRSDLAKIHIAKKELQLDDAAYRDLLRRHFGCRSAADLDRAQAGKLIDLFRAKGWRPASAAQRGLVRALWHRLEGAGAVAHGEEGALRSFVSHYAGRPDLRSLTVHEASRLIEMLKKWLERTGERDTRH